MVAVMFVMQFFVIRFGIFGDMAPDPDEMTYTEKVRYACDNGMMLHSRKAEDSVTKADLALALYGTADHDEEEAASRAAYEEEYGGAFKDVDGKALGGDTEEAVYWCALNNILYPESKGKFGPDDAVRTEDMIVAMRRLAAFSQMTLPVPEEEAAAFPDEKKAHEYAADEIEDMRAAGLLSGFEGDLSPTADATFERMVDISIRVKNALAEDTKREADEYRPIPDLYGLEKVFKDETKEFEGTWSMYISCFDTGETLIIGNKQMVSASLIKLFVAGTYFDELKKGELEETVDSKDDIDLMISESSNTAWTDLEGFIGDGSESAGRAKVNAFAERNGYTKTARHVPAKEGGGTANYTCVKDVGRVLNKLYYKKYVSKTASKVILGHMLDQVHVNKIPAGIPEGVKVANKTGELGTNEHDSAIVWAKNCTYALVIMSEDVNRAQIGYKQVAELSRAVYMYMTQ